AIAACSAYARQKASGASAAPELLASRDAARQAIWTAIMGNIVRHGGDEEWQEAIRTPVGPGSQFAGTSKLVRTCFAIGLAELRDTWGHLMERRAWEPQCLADFHQKANFEGQCFASTIRAESKTGPSGPARPTTCGARTRAQSRPSRGGTT
ncbi:unnamed protein product, partial [Prorocentrum cordatum]